MRTDPIFYLIPLPLKDVWPTPKALVSQARSDGCGAALSFLPLPEAVPEEQAARRGEGASPQTAAQSVLKWGTEVVVESSGVSLVLALLVPVGGGPTFG